MEEQNLDLLVNLIMFVFAFVYGFYIGYLTVRSNQKDEKDNDQLKNNSYKDNSYDTTNKPNYLLWHYDVCPITGKISRKPGIKL